MRYLILSDIHANWEALEAVLNSASGRYDQIICCGDLIGYGPDPNLVVEWARTNVHAVVRGNHDKIAAGAESLEWFNPVAKEAALWTLKELSPENTDYVAQLPQGPFPYDGYQIAHGSPLDEDEYLAGATDAAQTFPYLDCNLTFFGHTHVQGGFVWSRHRTEALRGPVFSADSRALDLDAGGMYLINPGAIGQPRDGDPRAAYILYTPEERCLQYLRAPYDIAKVQVKIRGAGLPGILADRLPVGH